MSQTRVFIGGLNPSCRESDLERFFAGYGRIRSMLLKRGYGFVEFEDRLDADDAVDNLNGTEMLGHKVQVEQAKPRQFRRYSDYRGGRRGGGGWGNYSNGRGRGGGYNYYQPRLQKRGTGFRVIVKNLSSRVTWQELKDFMRQAGYVTYADVSADLNEGTVEYRSYGELCRAIDTLDNAELAGWKIRLVEENKYRNGGKNWKGSNSSRSSRSNSRSRSKSRSRSRSRSKSRSKSRSPVRSRKR